MTTTRTVSVLHETGFGLDRPQQTYGLQRTYEVVTPVHLDRPDIRKVRVTVNVDAYVRQGRYVAETWTDLGWREVARIDPADPGFTDLDHARNLSPAVSGYVRESHAKAEFLEKVAVALLDRAMVVLT